MDITAIQFIELISAILGILGVWLNAKPHILGWPIGIISVILAGLVYFDSRLFAEFGLQIFYSVSGIYGWWKWTSNKEKASSVKISRINNKELAISILGGVFLSLVIGYFLKTKTTADFPWIDSGLASFSLVAQIWLARKYIENWLLWGIINIVSIGLYLTKDLWFFFGYFSILLIMSVWGYYNWGRKLKSEN